MVRILGFPVNGVSPRDVAKNLGVSVSTLYTWVPASGQPT